MRKAKVTSPTLVVAIYFCSFDYSVLHVRHFVEFVFSLVIFLFISFRARSATPLFWVISEASKANS